MELGADGIIISNHGGRQLNFAPAAVDMLPSVAEAVGGRVPLLVDGGITRGTGEGSRVALPSVLLGADIGPGLAAARGAFQRRSLSERRALQPAWEADRCPLLLRPPLAPSRAHPPLPTSAPSCTSRARGTSRVRCNPLSHPRPADVVKCLALGASAVLVGRPLLWALTLGGQRGVEEAVEMLRYELELSMALLGVQNVRQITDDFVIAPRGGHLHIPPARR